MRGHGCSYTTDFKGAGPDATCLAVKTEPTSGAGAGCPQVSERGSWAAYSWPKGGSCLVEYLCAFLRE